jgi:hypothetical protein
MPSQPASPVNCCCWGLRLCPGLPFVSKDCLQGFSASSNHRHMHQPCLCFVFAPSSLQHTDEVTSSAIAAGLISQLLLLGPEAVPWTVFVALHIKPLETREAALQQLLQVIGGGGSCRGGHSVGEQELSRQLARHSQQLYRPCVICSGFMQLSWLNSP